MGSESPQIAPHEICPPNTLWLLCSCALAAFCCVLARTTDTLRAMCAKRSMRRALNDACVSALVASYSIFGVKSPAPGALYVASFECMCEVTAQRYSVIRLSRFSSGPSALRTSGSVILVRLQKCYYTIRLDACIQMLLFTSAVH